MTGIKPAMLDIARGLPKGPCLHCMRSTEPEPPHVAVQCHAYAVANRPARGATGPHTRSRMTDSSSDVAEMSVPRRGSVVKVRLNARPSRERSCRFPKEAIGVDGAEDGPAAIEDH